MGRTRRRAVLDRRPGGDARLQAGLACFLAVPRARPATMNSDEQAIISRLDRLSALVFARDPTIVDELWCDLGFPLYGSERGERPETRDELRALFQRLFSKPCLVSRP